MAYVDERRDNMKRGPYGTAIQINYWLYAYVSPFQQQVTEARL